MEKDKFIKKFMASQNLYCIVYFCIWFPCRMSLLLGLCNYLVKINIIKFVYFVLVLLCCRHYDATIFNCGE